MREKSIHSKLFILLQTFFKCLFFLFERDTEYKQGRGRERRRHRIQSRLQAPSCQHRARHGAGTHDLWDHDLSWSQMLNWLNHPGGPAYVIFEKELYVLSGDHVTNASRRETSGLALQGCENRGTAGCSHWPPSHQELQTLGHLRGLQNLRNECASVMFSYQGSNKPKK